MDSVGERLRLAIEQQIGSVRKFRRELHDHAPDLRGTARQTLYRYFKGESEPGPGIIKAAADLLGVREDWLARGDGEMTPEAERLRRAQEAAMMDDEESLEPIRELLDTMAEGEGPDLRGSMAPAATFFDLAIRYVQWWGEDDLGVAADKLGRLIMAPVREFGLDPFPHTPEFRDYVVAMNHALALALRIDRAEPEEPDEEENDG